jgi:aryl-alcohol dehydrogenase-like predicted oxidoreductase
VLAGNRGRGGARHTERARNDAFGDSLYTEDDFAIVDANAEVAAERGVAPAQVALAWVMSRPGITAPIIGATKLGHIDDAAASTELTLDEKEIERLEALYRPHAISGHG